MQNKKANTDSKSKVYVETKTSGVAIIHLQAPKLNALSSEVLSSIAESLERIQADDKIRVAVIYGGDKAFSSGTDTSEFKNKKSIEMIYDQRCAMWERIRAFRKPLVAAIHRMAVGSGFELVLSCDLAIASEDAIFGQPEINLGLIPGAGATSFLLKTVGKAKAMKILLTGEYFDAEHALGMGLVSEVVSKEKTLNRALEIAKTISEKSPKSCEFIKDIVRHKMADTDINKIERLYFAHLFSSKLKI